MKWRSRPKFKDGIMPLLGQYSEFVQFVRTALKVWVEGEFRVPSQDNGRMVDPFHRHNYCGELGREAPSKWLTDTLLVRARINYCIPYGFLLLC